MSSKSDMASTKNQVKISNVGDATNHTLRYLRKVMKDAEAAGKDPRNIQISIEDLMAGCVYVPKGENFEQQCEE